MKTLTTNLVDWLDSRTGIKEILHEALYERVPGGARWRYVWGSTLVVAFVTQVITGIFLWMAYSPSTQTAWESVFYIQEEMGGGWFLRGIHHYMASMMIVLLAIHFVQVVWDGAYRAPRELNFVLGLVLMLIVLGLSLTGYLLPWDQKGYWATNVGTELASQAPVAGGAIKKLAVGGSSYGHHTLTRFFALHAGVLPGALVAFLALHLALFRKHGLTPKEPIKNPDVMFWPDQVLKDSVAALGVLAAVMAVTIYTHGAELTAPADPANNYAAARPEWYFLFLFQFLKWFPGELEVWGAFVIPGLIVGVMFLMPWIGRWKIGHFFNVAFMAVLLGGAAMLTVQAIQDDTLAGSADATFAESGMADTPENRAAFTASQEFLKAKIDGEHNAKRVIELAKANGIPPTGALTLVYDDPYLQGPKLFAQHCASCHNYEPLTFDDYESANPGEEIQEMLEAARASVEDWKETIDALKNSKFTNFHNTEPIINSNPTAPNLYPISQFNSWFSNWLNPRLINSKHLLGYEDSPFKDGDMTSFILESYGDIDPYDESQTVVQAFSKISWALFDEAQLPVSVLDDGRIQTAIEEGRSLITGELADIVDSGMSCTDCHKFHDEGDLGSAPDLTGYMSRQWMIDFIRNPSGDRFYPDTNDRMPAFAPHDDPQLNQLDDKTLGLIVDWLRGDWVRPESAPLAE